MDKRIRNQRIVIVLLVLLLVINLFSVMNLKQKLDNVNNDVNNSLQSIRSNVNMILSEIGNINNEKEKQLSLITDFDCEYGELDKIKMTVPVKVKIVPKTLTDDTLLSLEFGTRTVEMKKSDEISVFTAEFEAALFEQSNNGNVKLVVKNGSTAQTEELDWSLDYLRSEFLPFIGANFIFSKITHNPKTGITVKGTVSGYIDEDDKDSFRNIKLIFKINGKSLSEDPIDDADWHEVNKTFPGYGEGDTFELYLEAEDELGLIHEIMLKKVMFGGEDEIYEETEPVNGGETIRDKQGNILYS